MTLLAGWPTLTDDAGDGTSGTVLDKSVFDTIKSEIENVTHSTNNTTIDPNDITDEVVTARGNLTSLEDRIDGVIDSDGALITPASIVSSSQLQSHSASALNLIKNSTFWCWPKTLASDPAYWKVANGTIAIAGTGQSDTQRYVGQYCAKVTHSSGTATLSQIILDTTDFANLDHLKVETKKIGVGCWIYTGIASHARIQVADGNTTTESDYHTGTPGWEWISTVHTMSAASTKLTIVLQNTQAGSCYFSGVVANFADFAPALWWPEPKVRGSANIEIAGPLSTGDGKKLISFARPIRLDHIQAMVGTDPTGDGIDIDFEKYEPTDAWASMGTAGELIADGDGTGQWLMSTTATRLHDRCLRGWFGPSGELAASGQENKIARLNIDTVGLTTPGKDMFMRIDGVQCVHPFEDQYAFDDQGV
jgi:hypothetical protein